MFGVAALTPATAPAMRPSQPPPTSANGDSFGKNVSIKPCTAMPATWPPYCMARLISSMAIWAAAAAAAPPAPKEAAPPAAPAALTAACSAIPMMPPLGLMPCPCGRFSPWLGWRPTGTVGSFSTGRGGNGAGNGAPPSVGGPVTSPGCGPGCHHGGTPPVYGTPCGAAGIPKPPSPVGVPPHGEYTGFCRGGAGGGVFAGSNPAPSLGSVLP